MTRSDFGRALFFPFSDAVLLIAMVALTLVTTVLSHAGLFGLVLGVLCAPALYRYLLLLLEARALGRATPVADIGLFDFAGNFWSLTPLVLTAAAFWGGFWLHRQVSPLAGQGVALLLLAALPASFAVLALTRSPLESLDPRAIVRLVRACGPAYALVPAATLLVAGTIVLLALLGTPSLVMRLAGYYALFLLFTLTGSVLRSENVDLSLDIADAGVPEAGIAEARRAQLRRQVLTHAYGFMSRDNRAGGLAHIRRALQEEADDEEAWRWYFDEMLKWESKDGALMLAQAWLTRLLGERRDVEAVKLMSRCLLVDARFRPLPGDRDAARAVAERLERNDLVRALDL